MDRRHFALRLHGGFGAAAQNFDGVVSSFHTRGRPKVVCGAASARFRVLAEVRPSDLHAEPGPSAVIFHIAVSRQPIVRESRLVSWQIDSRTQPLVAEADRLVLKDLVNFAAWTHPAVDKQKSPSRSVTIDPPSRPNRNGW